MVLSTTAAGTISHSARGLSSLATSSASEVAPVAPSLASAATASADLSNTVQAWPPFNRRRTMFAPMRPRPIIPSCMSLSSSLAGRFTRP